MSLPVLSCGQTHSHIAMEKFATLTKSVLIPLLSSLKPEGGNSAICWKRDAPRAVLALSWSGLTRFELKVEVRFVPCV